MDNIKTVFLDVDNTLLDFQKAQHNALCDAFALLGYPVDDEILTKYDLHNKSYWKKFENGEITRERLVIERFETFFASLGIDGDAVKCERLYREALGEQADYMDGAKEGLIYLSGKYPVCLVTNGLKKTQYSRIAKSGIDKYVDRIFISEEVGYRKPQREFFTYALSVSGASPAHTVMIGDGYSGDICGARDMGIRTIWYNPSSKIGSADIIMHDWSEISSYL